jgi:prophage regulatory protein
VVVPTITTIVIEDRIMRVLSYSDLRPLKGIVWTRRHINRLIKAGRFPRPLKIGDATVARAEDEIDAWLGEHLAERDQHNAA